MILQNKQQSQSVQSIDKQSDIKDLLLLLLFSYLLFLHSLWRETFLFTNQVNVQSRENHFNHNNHEGNMPTLAGNKHLTVLFFLYRPRLFHFSTEKVCVQSVGNWHQSAYFRGHTINNNINRRSKSFPPEESLNKCSKITWITVRFSKTIILTCLGPPFYQSIFRIKLGFFLVRSSLPPTGSSLWPKCSGTIT